LPHTLRPCGRRSAPGPLAARATRRDGRHCARAAQRAAAPCGTEEGAGRALRPTPARSRLHAARAAAAGIARAGCRAQRARHCRVARSTRPRRSTMSDALPALTGGCLCGRTRYEAAPDHREGYYCHCRMCQLAFGNTRAAFVNLRKAEVRWLSAPAYYASSKIARRGFCVRCGTPLSFEYLDSERMDLAVGSLDE